MSTPSDSDPTALAPLRAFFRRFEPPTDPAALEPVAELLDGTLHVARRADVEATIAADPELSSLCESAWSRRTHPDTHKFIIPEHSSHHIGVRAVAAATQLARMNRPAPAGIHPLPRPERPERSLSGVRRVITWLLILGAGGMVAALIAARHAAPPPPNPNEQITLSLRHDDALIRTRSREDGYVLIALATEHATELIGTLELLRGHRTLFARIPPPGPSPSRCRTLIALTVAADARATAAALLTQAHTDTSCQLIAPTELQTTTHARALTTLPLQE